MLIVISCSGSANPYESEDGYHSVSREAAQSLQAPGPAAEPDYALVDQSRKKKNRMAANDEYAQVDKSKKTMKKKKVRMTRHHLKYGLYLSLYLLLFSLLHWKRLALIRVTLRLAI